VSSRRTRVPLRVTEVIDYAVKAAVLLGTRQGEYLSSVEIADHYGMSPKMLGQVLRALGVAGILVARQGWHGGFSLAEPADRVSLRSVIAAVGGADGAPVVGATPHHGDAAIDGNEASGVAVAVDRFWTTLDAQVQETLETMTVGDLLAETSAH